MGNTIRQFENTLSNMEQQTEYWKILTQGLSNINFSEDLYVVVGGKLLENSIYDDTTLNYKVISLADKVCEIINNNDGNLVSYSSSFNDYRKDTTYMSSKTNKMVNYNHFMDSVPLCEYIKNESHKYRRVIVHMMYAKTSAVKEEVLDNVNVTKEILDELLSKDIPLEKLRVVYTHTWSAMPPNTFNGQIDSFEGLGHLIDYKLSKLRSIAVLMERMAPEKYKKELNIIKNELDLAQELENSDKRTHIIKESIKIITLKYIIYFKTLI